MLYYIVSYHILWYFLYIYYNIYIYMICIFINIYYITYIYISSYIYIYILYIYVYKSWGCAVSCNVVKKPCNWSSTFAVALILYLWWVESPIVTYKVAWKKWLNAMVCARYNEHYNGYNGLIMVYKPTFTSPGCHSQAIPTWGLSRHKSGPIAPCS